MDSIENYQQEEAGLETIKFLNQFKKDLLFEDLRQYISLASMTFEGIAEIVPEYKEKIKLLDYLMM